MFSLGFKARLGDHVNFKGHYQLSGQESKNEVAKYKEGPWRTGSVWQGSVERRWNSGWSGQRVCKGQQRQEFIWKWWKIILSSMGGVGFLEIFGRPQMNLAGIRSSSWVAGTGATWREYCFRSVERCKEDGLEKGFLEARWERRTVEMLHRISKQEVHSPRGR